MMVYTIVFVIVVFILMFGSYMIYDYITYKQDLDDNLEKSKEAINYNFGISADNISYVHEATKDNKTAIDAQKIRIDDLSAYTSNTSNYLAKDLQVHSLNNINTFNAFDTNLSKYFEFNADSKTIAGTEANKIYSYTMNTPTTANMKLITQTTAVGGLTVLSDVNKELKICKMVGQTPNCIKANVMGNDFIFQPETSAASQGAHNIVFKNNTRTLAKFNIKDNEIYLGGDNPANSVMYITNNGAYFNKPIYLTPGGTTAGGNPYKIINYSTYTQSPINIPTTISYITKTTTTTSGSTTTTISYEIIFDFSSLIPSSGTLEYQINIRSMLFIQYPNSLTNATIENITGGTFSIGDSSFTPIGNVQYNNNGVFTFTTNTVITSSNKKIKYSASNKSLTQGTSADDIDVITTPVATNTILFPQ